MLEQNPETIVKYYSNKKTIKSKNKMVFFIILILFLLFYFYIFHLSKNILLENEIQFSNIESKTLMIFTLVFYFLLLKIFLS